MCPIIFDRAGTPSWMLRGKIWTGISDVQVWSAVSDPLLAKSAQGVPHRPWPGLTASGGLLKSAEIQARWCQPWVSAARRPVRFSFCRVYRRTSGVMGLSFNWPVGLGRPGLARGNRRLAALPPLSGDNPRAPWLWARGLDAFCWRGVSLWTAGYRRMRAVLW